MTITIYADVLFLTNFMIDYALLFFTAFFIKQSPKIRKLTLASSVGALYATAAFFMPMPAWVAWGLAALCAHVMIKLAFCAKGILHVKHTATFLTISFLAGGVGFTFLCSHNTIPYLVSGISVYMEVHAYTLFCCFAVVFFLLHLALAHLQKQRIKAPFLHTITIEKDKNTITTSALFDTGNFLRHPLNQRSVILAEWQVIAPLFDNSSLHKYIGEHPNVFTKIPCRNASGTASFFAFLPDKIRIENVETPYVMYVAITEYPLDKEQHYHCILPNDTNIKTHSERIPSLCQ